MKWMDALLVPNGTEKSLSNCHIPNLDSVVFDVNRAHGQLTRAFIGEVPPGALAFHSHRQGITITVLRGHVVHHTALMGGGISLPVYKYRSKLLGGSGLEYKCRESYSIHSEVLPVGSVIKLHHHELHSMETSKDAVWVVEEEKAVTQVTTVLGAPFSVEGLYTPMSDTRLHEQISMLQSLVADITWI